LLKGRGARRGRDGKRKGNLPVKAKGDELSTRLNLEKAGGGDPKGGGDKKEMEGEKEEKVKATLPGREKISFSEIDKE